MNVDNIVKQVTDLLAPYDAESLALKLEAAKKSRIDLAAYRADPESRETAKKDPWRYYAKLYAICGGKGMYEKVNNNSLPGLLKVLTKDHGLLVEARCNKIAAKLASIGIIEVKDGGFMKSHDGFQGLYKISTVQGDVKIRIQVIVAGGYNIQCRHCRVLVNIVN